MGELIESSIHDLRSEAEANPEIFWAKEAEKLH